MQQLLPHAFRLSVDYGRLPAFQSTTVNAPDMSRLLVMLRRSVTLRTPAAGADLEGLVRDDSGTPVAGAVVSLGRYRTPTREDGRYRVAHVPPGQHDLAVVREHLPADLYPRYLEEYERQLLEAMGDTGPFLYPFKRILFWGRKPL